jgi:hypothetical protein
VLGPLADSLRAAAIPVVDRLDDLAGAPDVLHGQHHVETLTALLHFPGLPGLAVCHGFAPWEEAPLLFPRLLRHVAVDVPTAERLTAAGVPAERIETVLSSVDLDLFRPRPPLPTRPRKALIFSNNAQESTHLAPIRLACERAGIDVDVAGIASGRVVDRPQDVLPAYDLVFAKARAALEALAVGAAVVLCDAAGCGPLVTASDLPRLRPLNFGFRTLDQTLSPEALGAQIERYDPLDAAEVCRQVRATAGLTAAVDRYIALYGTVYAEQRRRLRTARAAAFPVAESRAAAAYLAWLNPYLKERTRALIDRDALWQRVHELEAAAKR